MIAQLDAPFNLSQPAAQVLAIVLFVIPGLNATWVTERLAGRTIVPPTEQLLRAISWSVVIYASVSPWLVRIGHKQDSDLWVWEPVLAAVIVLLAAPLTLALTIAYLRRAAWAKGVLKRLTRIHPAPTAWDFAFGLEGPFFVRIKLKTGQRIGGEFAASSFATAYPDVRDLFLERAWILDDLGEFVAPVLDSKDMLVSWDDVEQMEFLAPSREGDSIDG